MWSKGRWEEGRWEEGRWEEERGTVTESGKGGRRKGGRRKGGRRGSGRMGGGTKEGGTRGGGEYLMGGGGRRGREVEEGVWRYIRLSIVRTDGWMSVPSEMDAGVRVPLRRMGWDGTSTLSPPTPPIWGTGVWGWREDEGVWNRSPIGGEGLNSTAHVAHVG